MSTTVQRSRIEYGAESTSARLCSITDCGRPHYGRGWCRMHYKRWHKHGDPHYCGIGGSGGRRVPAEQRFWPKVNKDGPVPVHVPELGPCWVWTGAKAPYGHGAFARGGKGRAVGSHRFAYELMVEPIPNGLCVLHRCDNPCCVNPEHLFLGTQADNMYDAIAKGRVPQLTSRRA